MSSLETLDDPRAERRRRDVPPSRSMSDGPRWYRVRIRSRGPFVALIPPLLVGAVALVLVNVGDRTITGVAGLVSGTWAAPGLLVVGAPLADSSSYPPAIAGSVLFWLLVGFAAARRATRHPMADWGDYWRHYAWSAIGVLIGVSGALGAVAWIFGRDLL